MANKKKPIKKKTKSKKKVDKQSLFIEAYLQNGFNATRAYLDSGHKCTEETAAVKGYLWIRKDKIKKEIEKRVQELLGDKKELTVKWLNEVNAIGFSEKRDTIKLKALELLGKYLSLFTETVNNIGQITIVIEKELSQNYK